MWSFLKYLFVSVRIALFALCVYYLIIVRGVAFFASFYLDAQRYADLVFSMYELRPVEVFLVRYPTGPAADFVVNVTRFAIFAAPLLGWWVVTTVRISWKYLALISFWSVIFFRETVGAREMSYVVSNSLQSVCAFGFGMVFPYLVHYRGRRPRGAMNQWRAGQV